MLVLLVLTDTKIRYHYGKMANFVSPNQIQIQIGLVLLVRPDTCDDTSQPCIQTPFSVPHLLLVVQSQLGEVLRQRGGDAGGGG